MQRYRPSSSTRIVTVRSGNRDRYLSSIRSRRSSSVALGRAAPRYVRQYNRNYPRRGEMKYVDLGNAAYVCDTTGSVTLLNGIAEGYTQSTRIGRKCTIRSIQLSGIVKPVDASTSNCHCRLMVVQDLAPGAAVPAITDILTASVSNAFQNLNNAARFRVLWSYNKVVGAVDTTATASYAGSPTVHLVNAYKRTAVPVQYKDTNALISSISTNAIYLVTVGSVAPAAGGSFDGAIRIRYSDD